MDDEQDFKKIIDEQIESLPDDIKEAILSVDYSSKLQEIVRRQRLMIDQAGKLDNETTLVMLGLEPLADYVQNLERELSLTPLRANEVATDVNENIFRPIRNSLQSMNRGEKNEEKNEDIATKFTNTNEVELNRDQILKEIEDPSIIGGETVSAKETTSLILPVDNDLIERNDVERDVAIVPNETVKEIKPKPDIFRAKMTGTSVVSEEKIRQETENKLPAIEKKKPTSGIDPYREPIE